MKLYKITFKIKQFHPIEYDYMYDNIYYTRNINEPDYFNCTNFEGKYKEKVNEEY